jgi:hypothetical protein
MTQKIDAVNQCLRAIDEAPVNSLSSGVDEAERAATFIDQVTREVLSAGWHNNTDYNITVTPDTAGEIGASADWISIDTVGYSSSIDVTVRVDPNDGSRSCSTSVSSGSPSTPRSPSTSSATTTSTPSLSSSQRSSQPTLPDASKRT